MYYILHCLLPKTQLIKMTTYMQEMFEALVLNDIPLPQDIKVNKYITNHIDLLTKKELDDITTVFRSMETGLREAIIYPKVPSNCVCCQSSIVHWP